MKYKNGTEAKVGDQALAVITTVVPTGEIKKTDKGLQTVNATLSSIEVGTLTNFNEKEGTAVLVTGDSKSPTVKVSECYSIDDAVKALNGGK